MDELAEPEADLVSLLTQTTDSAFDPPKSQLLTVALTLTRETLDAPCPLLLSTLKPN